MNARRTTGRSRRGSMKQLMESSAAPVYPPGIRSSEKYKEAQKRLNQLAQEQVERLGKRKKNTKPIEGNT